MPMIAANGINIYHEVCGEGEPLVLIGGLSIDATAFRAVIPALSQHYEVVAFDNRGSGGSDKPDIPYSIPMMADDTAGLLKQLGIPQADILGVSMGGRIAVELALRHPDLVRSLILVSTFVRPAQDGAGRRWLDLITRFPLLRTIGKKYPQPQYAFLHQRAASRNYDATDRLREIGAATLILHGSRDRVAPLNLAKEMHAGIRNSVMRTFDGGHAFLFFRPNQVVAAIREFLASPR